MRPLLPWGCAVALQSVVHTAGRSAASWECGEVQDDGNTWVHDANPDCGGKGTISQNKCWLRKGVNTYNCQEVDDYDYHVKNPSSGEYVKSPGMNCYPGQGVTWGPDAEYGHDPLSVGLGGCKKSCSKDPQCEGIVVHSPAGVEDQEIMIERCWLRVGITLSSCHNGTGYDTYFHTKAHPADFSQHLPGVNCYAGAGADGSYGTSELAYPDGKWITHLGECKAACHRDAGRCEGITVQHKSGKRALADPGGGAASGLFAAAAAPAAATPPAAVRRATSWLAPAGLCLALLSAACVAAAAVRRAPAAGDGRGLALVRPEAEDASDDA